MQCGNGRYARATPRTSAQPVAIPIRRSGAKGNRPLVTRCSSRCAPLDTRYPPSCSAVELWRPRLCWVQSWAICAQGPPVSTSAEPPNSRCCQSTSFRAPERPGALLNVLGSPDCLRGSQAGGRETWLRLIRQPRGGGLHIANRYDKCPAIRSAGLLLCTRGPARFPSPADADRGLHGGDQAQLVRISIAAGRCAC
jgi:hypothetical protein